MCLSDAWLLCASLTLLPSHTGCVLLLSPRLTWKTEVVVPFLNKSLYGSFSCLQDPERQGPPSRQGSALVNGINWSDRRSSGALPPGPAAFARSRSLPHPQDALYPDRSASLNTYLPSECSRLFVRVLVGGLLVHASAQSAQSGPLRSLSTYLPREWLVRGRWPAGCGG